MLTIRFLLDGTPIGAVGSFSGSNQTTVDIPVPWGTLGAVSAFVFAQVSSPTTTDWLWEPGSATSHTLTAQVADACGTGGGATGGHFTVNSITIDVLGAQ